MVERFGLLAGAGDGAAPGRVGGFAELRAYLDVKPGFAGRAPERLSGDRQLAVLDPERGSGMIRLGIIAPLDEELVAFLKADVEAEGSYPFLVVRGVEEVRVESRFCFRGIRELEAMLASAGVRADDGDRGFRAGPGERGLAAERGGLEAFMQFQQRGLRFHVQGH